MPPIMCTIISAQFHIGNIGTMIFQLHIPERIIKSKIAKQIVDIQKVILFSNTTIHNILV